jgi:hypothetical protein
MLSTNAHRELDTYSHSIICHFTSWFRTMRFLSNPHRMNSRLRHAYKYPRAIGTSFFPGDPTRRKRNGVFAPAAMMTTSPFRPEKGTQSNVALCESDICEDRTPMNPRQQRSKFAKGVREMSWTCGKDEIHDPSSTPFAAVLQQNASIRGGSNLAEGKEKFSEISARQIDQVSHRSEAFALSCTGADLFCIALQRLKISQGRNDARNSSDAGCSSPEMPKSQIKKSSTRPSPGSAHPHLTLRASEGESYVWFQATSERLGRRFASINNRI